MTLKITPLREQLQLKNKKITKLNELIIRNIKIQLIYEENLLKKIKKKKIKIKSNF